MGTSGVARHGKPKQDKNGDRQPPNDQTQLVSSTESNLKHCRRFLKPVNAAEHVIRIGVVPERRRAFCRGNTI